MFYFPSMSKFYVLLDTFDAKNCASTQKIHRYKLTEWVNFLGECDPFSPPESKIWEFLAFQRSKEGHKSRISEDDTLLSWRSIRDKFDFLRRYYSFLVSYGHAEKNPFLKPEFDFSKNKSPLKRPLQIVPFDVVEKIRATPGCGTKDGVRDTAFLTLAFATGARIGEIMALKMRDIKQTAKGTVFLRYVRTKGQIHRDQALPTWAHEDLERLITQRKNEGALEGDSLWINYIGYRFQQGKNRSGRSMARMFEQACAMLGLTDLTPHSIRTTVVSKLIEDNMPHHKIREVSGHKSVQMVEYYSKFVRSIDEAPGLAHSFQKKN